MDVRHMLIALITFPLSAAANAVDIKKCEYELNATVAALGMRDHGKTKEDLESTLPPKAITIGDAQADLVHSIIDDIYSRPDISAFSYLHYRGVRCLVKTEGVAVSFPFKDIADEIATCQQKHGTKQSPPLIGCISDAFHSRL